MGHIVKSNTCFYLLLAVASTSRFQATPNVWWHFKSSIVVKHYVFLWRLLEVGISLISIYMQWCLQSLVETFIIECWPTNNSQGYGDCLTALLGMLHLGNLQMTNLFVTTTTMLVPPVPPTNLHHLFVSTMCRCWKHPFKHCLSYPVFVA